MERRRGLTPEVKRYKEIKAGVITGSVGIALMIFLNIFMPGIISGGKVPLDTAEILSRLWVVGVFPIFVGIALIMNGLFVSKKLVELARQRSQTESNILEGNIETRSLPPADTTEFKPSGFSVTEDTTKHLRSSGQKQ